MKKKLVSLCVCVCVMMSMVGCTTISQPGSTKEQKVASIISTALKIAYSAGGAELVCQRIDALVAEGKLTEEQGEQLKKAAQKAYETLIADLDSVAEGGDIQKISVASAIILAWESGGRDMVVAKVNQLVKDGKVTELEAAAIIAAADQGYAAIIEVLQNKELKK